MMIGFFFKLKKKKALRYSQAHYVIKIPVIPAPIAYIIFAAVKKLVVGFWAYTFGPPQGVYWMSWPSF